MRAEVARRKSLNAEIAENAEEISEKRGARGRE
jgi:hypothetical protein